MRLASSISCVPLVALLIFVCDSCKDETCNPDTTYNPTLNPLDFDPGTSNPLFPLEPGTSYHYEGGGESIDVTVTNDTKDILGITAIVVHDMVTVDGVVTEDTYDWYAQDNDGNVWYLGEDTKEYEGGHVASTEGSWEAGVNGAKPGIVMHASQPAVGSAYRQEYYACQAEDMAEVKSLSESVTVTYGTFDNCLQTREFTPLESDVNEYKYYAPGIGLVLEQDVGTGVRTELISVTP